MGEHYRIVAPHFVAGISTGGYINRTNDEWVRDVAPIVGYMRGWPIDRVRRYCAGKGWEFAKLFCQPRDGNAS